MPRLDSCAFFALFGSSVQRSSGPAVQTCAVHRPVSIASVKPAPSHSSTHIGCLNVPSRLSQIDCPGSIILRDSASRLSRTSREPRSPNDGQTTITARNVRNPPKAPRRTLQAVGCMSPNRTGHAGTFRSRSDARCDRDSQTILESRRANRAAGAGIRIAAYQWR